MKSPGRIFLQGLVILLPVVITLYVLAWLAISAESLFRKAILFFLPAAWYLPGMGLILGLLFVFGVGVLSHAWLFRKLFSWGERLLERVPLVKSIYTALRDLLTYFAQSGTEEFSQAVMVSFPGQGTRLFGFVARKSFEDLPAGIGDEDTVAVYLPMSYQVGGYTVYVPRERIEPVDISLEDGMRLALTAGVSTKKPD